MNSIKEELNRELNGFSFEPDVETIKERFVQMKKRRRTAVIAAVVLTAVIGMAAEMLLSNRAADTADHITVSEGKTHSFVLTASAAEVDEEYLSDLSEKDRDLLLGTSGVKIEVDLTNYEVQGENGETTIRTFKTFRVVGSTPIIVCGEDIESLVFHSDISSFYDPAADRQVNDQRVAYDADHPLNSALYWLIPEAFNQWCEEMNRDDREVDFSLLPRDHITVTAVFRDGTEMSCGMELWFNDEGILVGENELRAAVVGEAEK